MTGVRVATAADLEAVAALETAVFGAAAWSWDSVAGEFEAQGRSRHIVVVDGGEGVEGLIGYASLMYVAGLADLQRIAVHPGHQRRGWASRLLTSVLEAAVDHGCHKILLEVAADNEAALSLYARFEFREISRRQRYYSGRTDAVVMERGLARRSRGRA